MWILFLVWNWKSEFNFKYLWKLLNRYHEVVKIVCFTYLEANPRKEQGSIIQIPHTISEHTLRSILAKIVPLYHWGQLTAAWWIANRQPLTHKENYRFSSVWNDRGFICSFSILYDVPRGSIAHIHIFLKLKMKSSVVTVPSTSADMPWFYSDPNEFGL